MIEDPSDHDHHRDDPRAHHRHGGGGPLRWLRHAVRPHSHDHRSAPALLDAGEASRQGIRAAWISLAGMGMTAGAQVGVYVASGSVALLADTLHNLGHLVTTVPLIIAFRLGRRAPTARYPYGFRRAEDLVGLLIGAVIAVSALVVAWESAQAIARPREVANLGWVLAAGLVGAAGNELVARYRIRIGRRIGSAALVAEGQHARTDGLTSVAVVLGAIGVWAGVPMADPVVGLGIALVILWLLASSSRTVVSRLMDGVEDGTLDGISAVAAQVAGVEAVDRVRARWTGHRLEADLDVAVAADLDVAAGHRLAQEVHHALLHRVRHLEGATVHVHPPGVTAAHAATSPPPRGRDPRVTPGAASA